MRFEANRNVTDLRAIDVLLLKSRQEYQETLNLWKQTDHIMGILLKPQSRPQRTFLQKFYEGWLIFPAPSNFDPSDFLQGETNTRFFLLLRVCSNHYILHYRRCSFVCR